MPYVLFWVLFITTDANMVNCKYVVSILFITIIEYTQYSIISLRKKTKMFNFRNDGRAMNQ